MAPRKNLIGQKFSHLTVIGLDEEKTKEKKRTHWIVECDCPSHTRFSVNGSNLVGGNTTKCKDCKAINLVGQKFGRLLVIERLRNEQNQLVWKCQCDCGNIVIVRGDSLRSGHTQSCGCLQKERASEANTIDLVGQKFGKLTVVKETSRRDTSGNRYWLCNCDCGTKNHEVSGHHLKNGRIVSCGCVLSKGEEKIANILSNNNIDFKREYIIHDFYLSTGGNPRFDFAIYDNEELKYFIEYHGEQHYLARGNLYTPEKVSVIQQRDMEKEQYCKQNNIPLIIIPYTKFNTITLEDLII